MFNSLHFGRLKVPLKSFDFAISMSELVRYWRREGIHVLPYLVYFPFAARPTVADGVALINKSYF